MCVKDDRRGIGAKDARGRKREKTELGDVGVREGVKRAREEAERDRLARISLLHYLKH